MRSHKLLLFLLIALNLATSPLPQQNPHLVVYEGDTGPGVGKHIVFIAGDHEYRSEELLPALARIMARRFGFTASVFFTLDEDGFIEPGSSRIDGLEVLREADLLVLGLRFQDFPGEEMQHIVDYLDRGGPIVGIRTSTHAFNIAEGPFRPYTWNYDGDEYTGGFGRQVLGETWVGHNGTNHQQSTRLSVLPEQAAHPIMRGVEDIHVVSGGYQAYPPDDVVVLASAQPLSGMEPTAPPATDMQAMPAAWTRTYSAGGPAGRIFTTTQGASEDFLNDGFRRMLVNATLWAAGLEDSITADLDIDFVGPYHPVTFAFDGYRRGVRPSDMAGWDSPIMAPDKPTREAPAPATSTGGSR